MGRELSRTIQPHLISGAVEQFEKRKAVSGGAVADAATFLQRTGPPDRLTRRSQEVVNSRAWKVRHGVHLPGAPWQCCINIAVRPGRCLPTD